MSFELQAASCRLQASGKGIPNQWLYGQILRPFREKIKGRRKEMSVEQNKACVKRIVEEAINGKNLKKAGELVTANWSYHGAMGTEYKGLEGFKKMMNEFQTSVPDLHVRLLDVVAEGDKVFHRWSMEGNIKGAYQGVPMDGKHLSVTIYNLSRFVDGKEAEVWECLDTMALMQSMGMMPNMAQMGK
jgi:predicted ester cyclase